MRDSRVVALFFTVFVYSSHSMKLSRWSLETMQFIAVKLVLNLQFDDSLKDLHANDQYSLYFKKFKTYIYGYGSSEAKMLLLYR